MGESAEIERHFADLQPALLRFFAARISDRSTREELMSRVNERVLQRLREQGDLGGIVPFGIGVARNVLKEHWREQQRRHAAEATLTSTVENLGRDLSTTLETGPHTRRAMLSALHECLEALDEADRVLAERCYGEGKSKNNREQLAADLGVSRNTLDARISRLRARLETCVRQRLAGHAVSARG